MVVFRICIFIFCVSDYDLVIDYHSWKANVVADALSQKSSVTLAHIRTAYVPLLLDMKTLI